MCLWRRKSTLLGTPQVSFHGRWCIPLPVSSSTSPNWHLFPDNHLNNHSCKACTLNWDQRGAFFSSSEQQLAAYGWHHGLGLAVDVIQVIMFQWHLIAYVYKKDLTQRNTITKQGYLLFFIRLSFDWNTPLFFSFLFFPSFTVTHRDGKFRAELSKLTMIARTKHDELWLASMQMINWMCSCEMKEERNRTIAFLSPCRNFFD